jgi:subtilisin family serine protease
MSRRSGSPSGRVRSRTVRRALQLGVSVFLTASSIVLVASASASSSQRPSNFDRLEPGQVIEGVKSSTGRIARTDPELLGRTDGTIVNVLVKLDYDSTATYDGGVRNLPATSPTETGKELQENQAAVEAYESYVETVENEIVADIQEAVANESVQNSFKTVYGGVEMSLPANQVDALLKVDGVVAVQKNELEQPVTDRTPEFIGATEAWQALGGPIKAGEGVIVGVLDTGVWPEHPSYQDRGIERPPGAWRCDFGISGDPNDPAFVCNDKLIGAYAFVTTYLRLIGALPGEFCTETGPSTTARCSARDSVGHGTHTSSTAAGSPVESAPIFGIERGPISGIAPGAHVIMYRVCLDQGCFSADSVMAVQQAVRDGVDVLNFSISGGTNPYTDPVELAFLDAYAAGVQVNASAGNSGPGPGTANHGGPWTTTVGASTSDRHFLSDLQLTSPDGASFTRTGTTVTPGIEEPTRAVLAEEVPGYDDPLCQTPLPAAASGLVVACRRGVVGRVLKGYNVMLGGGAGMILYNVPAAQDINPDNHWLPAIHVPGPEEPLREFLSSREAYAQWATGDKRPVRGDVMAAFSSRGPLADFIKPDVTAPGVQILAGHSPTRAGAAVIDGGPPGELFQTIQGTSMSSPHSAGVAALVKAAHRDWRPGQIKSALMTSSIQDVVKEDGETPADPFDRGAGSIRANRAINPTVTFNVPASIYYMSATDPLNRVHINLPSIQVNPFGGEITTTRMLTNVSGRRQVLEAETQAAEGLTIQVNPRRLPLDPGESRSVRITIEGPGLANNRWYFGQITFDPRREGAVEAVVPVAVFRAQGALTLQHVCEPTTFPRGSNADCQVTVRNTAGQPASANLEVEGPRGRGLEITNVSPPAQPTERGFRWTGTLTPALAPRIVSLTPGGQEYIPLPFAPIPGVGDETAINFTVPPFEYGSETYTSLCMVSNGYAVVGGCTAEDINFVPQTFPNPARPNNVLAAFWTDLDPSQGGQLRAGTGSVGGVPYIILEWRNVPVFDAPSERQTFEIWIRTGTTEGVNYAYERVAGNGSADGLNVGAENRDGTTGVNLGRVPADGEELTVNTEPPTPGGSVTITYDAFGRRAGEYDVVARLTSNITVGTVTEAVHLTVTPQ